MPLHVICVQGGAGATSLAPCTDVDGVPHVPALLEVAAPGAVHFANAEQLFAYGLIAIVSFYAIGSVIGSILSLIRRG